MTKEIARIVYVEAMKPASLRLIWKDQYQSNVDLTGWIATGGEMLSSLGDWSNFMHAKCIDYGACVAWDDEGDLAIDAHHLRLLSGEQQPFRSCDAAEWQRRVKMSNQEAADFLGLALSTWNAYKAGSTTIPTAIGMACRSAERDPILIEAHFRPRKAGRPRKEAAPA